jgi:hypothetical protein
LKIKFFIILLCLTFLTPALAKDLSETGKAVEQGSFEAGKVVEIDEGAFGLVAEIPGVKFPESALLTSKGYFLLFTQDLGAECGYGTPVSVWKSDDGKNFVKIASLSDGKNAIQSVRYASVEFQGNYYAGSGWCGLKPPFYSSDGGKSWVSIEKGLEIIGRFATNQVFAYAVFNDELYAGTGYGPNGAAVYKLKGDHWEKVLGSPGAGLYEATVDLIVHNGYLHALISNVGEKENPATHRLQRTKDGSSWESVIGLTELGFRKPMWVYNGRLRFSADKEIYELQPEGNLNKIGQGYAILGIEELNGVHYAIGVVPGRKGQFFLMSEDGGANWKKIEAPGIGVKDNLAYFLFKLNNKIYFSIQGEPRIYLYTFTPKN